MLISQNVQKCFCGFYLRYLTFLNTEDYQNDSVLYIINETTSVDLG